jgi:hypothetical protein
MPKSLKNFKIVGDGVGRCPRDEQKTFKEARKSLKNFEMATCDRLPASLPHEVPKREGNRGVKRLKVTKSATQRHQVRFSAQAARRSEHGDISTRNLHEE